MDTTLRLTVLLLSSGNTIAVTSLTDSCSPLINGSIDNELSSSRISATWSPAFRCISSIHLFGSDKTYVDLPVNCSLRISLWSDPTNNIVAVSQHMNKQF